MHAVGLQAGAQRGRHLVVADEQRRAFGRNERVRQEHRVEADIGAAQVEQVGDVVQRRDEVGIRSEARHRFPCCGQLGGAGGGRERRGMFEHRVGGQAWTLAPDLVEQVDIRAQQDAARRQRIGEQPRGGQAKNPRVHRHCLAGRHVRRQPVDVQQAGARWNLHQRDAAAGQFGFGLGPVTPVGPHARQRRRGDEGTDRAGETGQPFSAFPVARQVFGQVRVGRRHDEGVNPVALHCRAQGFKSSGTLAGRCVNGHGNVEKMIGPPYDTCCTGRVRSRTGANLRRRARGCRRNRCGPALPSPAAAAPGWRAGARRPTGSRFLPAKSARPSRRLGKGGS